MNEQGEKEKKEEAARKSARPGKGRNPRLEREDEEVEIPKKEKNYQRWKHDIYIQI